MAIFIQIIATIVLLVGVVFIGSLIREYVEELFTFSNEPVSTPYITKVYGPIRTEIRHIIVTNKDGTSRVIKIKIKYRRGIE